MDSADTSVDLTSTEHTARMPCSERHREGGTLQTMKWSSVLAGADGAGPSRPEGVARPAIVGRELTYSATAAWLEVATRLNVVRGQVIRPVVKPCRQSLCHRPLPPNLHRKGATASSPRLVVEGSRQPEELRSRRGRGRREEPSLAAY